MLKFSRPFWGHLYMIQTEMQEEVEEWHDRVAKTLIGSSLHESNRDAVKSRSDMIELPRRFYGHLYV